MTAPSNASLILMPEPSTLLILHAAATFFMAGLIWFVQLVHYPLMARVGRENWIGYEHTHQRRTTWVVAPAMLLEAVTAALILLPMTAVTDTTGRTADPRAITAWIAAGLLLIIWISTFAIQVPLHAALTAGFDPRLHQRLVATNWIRTILWSARAVLITTLLA